MKKIFVLDTNVLLTNPDSIFKFKSNDVVIPISVIEEIDRFKKDMSEIGRNAREISRTLDNLRTKGTLSTGVNLSNDYEEKGDLFIYLGNNMSALPKLLVENTDNHILSIALTLHKQFSGERSVIVVTKDSNLRIKADSFGIIAEDYEADKLVVDDFYNGIVTIKADSATINEFYKNQELELTEHNFLPNQFVIIEDENNPEQKAYAIYNEQDKIIKTLAPQGSEVWGLLPRNIEQSFALEALLDDQIKLVTISGRAGTGKTLLAIASGLRKTTDEDEYQKLLVARPIFPLGKDIGFLPGDLNEKLNPWMQPIFDNLEFLLGGGKQSRTRLSKSYQELINQGILEVEPLTYIRGRSLPNQYFVVDEAQNLSTHEIKTILTRAGEGTKVILTGDPNQIDNPYLDSQNNGLTYVIESFKSEQIAAHISLKQGERSELATLASSLL